MSQVYVVVEFDKKPVSRQLGHFEDALAAVNLHDPEADVVFLFIDENSNAMAEELVAAIAELAPEFP